MSREEISSLQFLPPWGLRGDMLNYGLGLMSCYSITDVPSIVSGGYLYMFDPRGMAFALPSNHSPAAKMFTLTGIGIFHFCFASFMKLHLIRLLFFFPSNKVTLFPCELQVPI